MPYKIVGSKVMHRKGGEWSVKQTCDSNAKAKAAVRLLQGLEHGGIKASDVGKSKKKRGK